MPTRCSPEAEARIRALTGNLEHNPTKTRPINVGGTYAFGFWGADGGDHLEPLAFMLCRVCQRLETRPETGGLFDVDFGFDEEVELVESVYGFELFDP